MKQRVQEWVGRFALSDELRACVFGVVMGLPEVVREDFIGDPRFTLYDYEPGPGVVMRVPVSAPRSGVASRSVVLKRTLRHRPEAFVKYVIAHELAHAHLRNRGAWPGG